MSFSTSGLYLSVRLFGEEGRGGADGGNGGRGGKGGPPGKILLFEFGSRSQISVSSREGWNGVGGQGGVGGNGGRNGNDLDVRCVRRNTASWGYNFVSTWSLVKTIPKGRALLGRNGACGATGGYQENKEQPVHYPKPALILNMYKSYLRENFRKAAVSPSLVQFLHQLDSNRDIRDIYDTLSLLDEQKSIEQQYCVLSDDVDFTPFYRSLLDRISDYAKRPKPGETSREHRKVFNYLYTATLGRIYNLKENSESSLVVHVAEYLNSVRKDIESLKDSQKTRNKLELINKYKMEYKLRIDEKIEEAKSLIAKLITPKMDDIGRKMDNNIEVLMEETLALEDQAEVEKQKLIDKKKELENSMVMRGFFDVFKVVGQAVSFFGPVGASVGLAIGASSTISESLLLDDETNPGETLELPKGAISDLRSMEQQLKEVRDQKVGRLNALLEEISEESTHYPEHLNDTKAILAHTRERLNGLDKKKLEFDKVREVEDEIKRELDRKEKELDSQKTSEKAKRAKEAVQKFEQAVKLIGTVFDSYSQHKNDKLRLNLMTDAIEQSGSKIDALKEYEGKIYSIIAPMVQNMQGDLDKIASDLQAKSRVSLDVTKWQVKEALRDIKTKMQKLTDGFTVSGDFLGCIDQLQAAMDILIDVYDHIQNYQEQQNLAAYIADITSTAAIDTSITNPLLSKPVKDLEFITNFNVVLQQYGTAIAAFKQFVFPFAHLYLEEMPIPSHLKPGNDTDSLITSVSTQIRAIEKKLKKYELSTKTEDRYIGRGIFSSDYVSSDPFFVWKNEQNKVMISQLLSGQEVLVKANVTDSDILDMDGIKFKFIDLHFKAKNETLQPQIDNITKGFEVRAIHLGNSYYRYGDKVYLMQTNSHDIQFHIEKKPDGTPLHTGGEYDAIKNGDFMLSPYASWRITLFRTTKRASFEDLKVYKDEVDLELAGYGHYVKVRELGGLDLHMDKYYKGMYAYNLSNSVSTRKRPKNALHRSGFKYFLSLLRLPSFRFL